MTLIIVPGKGPVHYTRIRYVPKNATVTLKFTTGPSPESSNIISSGEWYDFTVAFYNCTPDFETEVEFPKPNDAKDYVLGIRYMIISGLNAEINFKITNLDGSTSLLLAKNIVLDGTEKYLDASDWSVDLLLVKSIKAVVKLSLPAGVDQTSITVNYSGTLLLL